MTRKYFEALSAALRASKPEYDDYTAESILVWEDACCAVSAALARLNTAFDSQRFLRDCGFRS